MRALTEHVPVGFREILTAITGDVAIQDPVSEHIEAGFETATYFPSARAALVAALRDAGLSADDTVIIPAYACHALASAVESVATPQFVDVDSETYNIDLDEVRAVAATADAIVPVHLFGLPVEMTAVRRIADIHDLVVIEDAAQALGAALTDTSVGTYADYCVFSFRFTKEVTTYKGGVLLSDGAEVTTTVEPNRTAPLALGAVKSFNATFSALPGPAYEPIRRCLLDPLFRSTAETVGTTGSRQLTTFQARLLETQLDELPARVPQRRSYAARFDRGIEGPVTLPTDPGAHTYFRYPVLVDSGDKSRICRTLRSRGIGVSEMYSYTLAPSGEYPIAADLADRVMDLPVHAGLRTSDVEYIISVFNEVVERDK